MQHDQIHEDNHVDRPGLRTVEGVEDGSGVVFAKWSLRMVPKRGTFGDLDETFKGFPRPFEEQARVVQETIASKIETVGDER